MGRGLSPRGRGNRGDRLITTSRIGSIPAWAGKPVGSAGHSGFGRVYPRVGGETVDPSFTCIVIDGLSPRGRGNRRLSRYLAVRLRSIPAWAGKPQVSHESSTSIMVYPRVGGETTPIITDMTPEQGLSPRGRGNPASIPGAAAGAGSIPAWAGKPKRCRTARTERWVYPRVGGETCKPGTPGFPDLGLSPRGRGNRTAGSYLSELSRSIPAWAGKPPRCRPDTPG